jgi:hypothetical protein
LKENEDLEISFGEPNYKNLKGKIKVPIRENEKVFYIKIAKKTK